MVKLNSEGKEFMKKIIHSFFISFYILLIFLLFPIYYYGQSYLAFRYEQQQLLEKTKFKIGPFRIAPAIRLRDIGYDNNVYLQLEEERPIADYTGAISLDIKAYLLFHNYLIFSFVVNPEYVYYFKQKKERRWNKLLSPEIKLLLLKRFVVSGSYLYSKKRYRVSSEFDIRANVENKRYNIHLFYETARNTSFGFSGTVSKIKFEDEKKPEDKIYLSRILDREEKTGSFEFYYQIFSESFFFMNAGYTKYIFKHSESRWRNSFSFQLYSGIRFPVVGKVRGIFIVGYKRLFPELSKKKGFSGIVGDSSLYYRVWHIGFRFQYSRDCVFSYWTNNIFFIENLYRLGISYYLTRFLRLDYDFSYGEVKYPETMTLWLPDGRYESIYRKDIYRTYSFGVVFRIISNTGIGIKANFWERNSNIYWENRNRMFVGGYLTYEF